MHKAIYLLIVLAVTLLPLRNTVAQDTLSTKPLIIENKDTTQHSPFLPTKYGKKEKKNFDFIKDYSEYTIKNNLVAGYDIKNKLTTGRRMMWGAFPFFLAGLGLQIDYFIRWQTGTQAAAPFLWAPGGSVFIAGAVYYCRWRKYARLIKLSGGATPNGIGLTGMF